MNRRTALGVQLEKGYIYIKRFRQIQTVKKNAKKRLKILHGGYQGEKGEFESVVVPFWKQFGITPKKSWYQMYCDGRGAFDPRYIPDDMMQAKIYPYFNNLLLGKAYADKCAYDMIFKDLRRPRTIIKNWCGRYFDGQGNLIGRDEALALCLKEKEFLVKCSTYASEGRDIVVLAGDDINQKSVSDLLDTYGMNFIVQEFVKQHEDLSRLNSSTLNTLRVQSFFFKGETHILSAQLRIGSPASRVDNYSAGGYACNINPDGRLSERAVNKARGWANEHENGFKFCDVVVPSYDRVIEIIKREHTKLPLLNIIGWDFGIGEDGEPVFIEINVTPETNQNGSGPTFGDMTEEVLRDVFITKSLKDAFN